MLYIVDQHAAHERVLYDKVRSVLNKGSLDAQILLEPEAITLSTADYNSVMENLELFTRMGFEVEPFGENTVLVRCVPYIFNGPMDPKDFQDMASFLSDGSRNSSGDVLLDRMAMMSCKAGGQGKSCADTGGGPVRSFRLWHRRRTLRIARTDVRRS